MAPTHHKETAFNKDDVTVVFVLGGPGAGKGTQCANLVRDYGFKHLSAGDLLRAEQDRPDSQYGELIKKNIREGTIVPMEVTVKLLENAMRDSLNSGSGRFLIDGFPRKMDQAEAFERDIVPSTFTLFYSCPEDVLRERLLKRGETSGRADDNDESIKKRFKTFEDTSLPVVKWFEKSGRVESIDASGSKEEVYAETQSRMNKRLAEKEGTEEPTQEAAAASG